MPDLREQVSASVTAAQTPRLGSLVVGALGSLAIGAGVPYCKMVLHGSMIAAYFNTPAALILFFFVGLFGNAAVGLVHRPWMLRRAELALVYIMWIVATSIPTWGFSSFLLPDITSVIYYATPENDWRDSLVPFIPEWIIPHHDLAQIKYFYEGAPAGQGIPWGLWLRPLAYWIPFAMALYMAMISTMVILRKQWIDNERLIYPLAQVPLAMMEDGENRSALIRPFFKNPLMWLGFSVPATLQGINGLHFYFPFIPRVDIASWTGFTLPLYRDIVSLKIALSFQMLGFSYFVNRDIAFGLWFFHLLNVLQQGVYDVMGFQKIDPVLGAYGRYTGSIIVHQGFGAIIVLVLFGLWTARGHLRAVFRKALRGDPEVDDSAEILSYRAAVWLLAGSLVFVGLWLWQSGLPGWITPIYVFLAFLLFIGITRVVAEGGLAFVFAPMVVSDFVAAGFGTRALGPSGIVALAFTYVWASDILTFVMVACANGLKIVEETIRRRRRLIFWAMLVAIVVSLLSSIWSILELSYLYGGINADGFFFTRANQYPFDNAVARMNMSEGPHWANWGHTAVGGGIMALLMAARQRFIWWPFHPLGFPISAHFGTMFFSVFLAWAIKSVVFKYGGPGLYLKTRPFFLGLILGQFVPAGVWYVVDYLAGASGNRVMSW